VSKSKWQVDAEAAIAQLVLTQTAFTRAGLYLTSLLLDDVQRVAEYEMATEIQRNKEHKEFHRKKTKK
jgi:hypothetical protein